MTLELQTGERNSSVALPFEVVTNYKHFVSGHIYRGRLMDTEFGNVFGVCYITKKNFFGVCYIYGTWGVPGQCFFYDAFQTFNFRPTTNTFWIFELSADWLLCIRRKTG